MSIELERAKADRRLILTRQRLLEQVLRAKIEAARDKEGCPDPRCFVCKRKRARILTLERRLSVVLLATMDPRLVRGAREWARRLLEAPRGLRHRRIGTVRPAVERYLIDRGYYLNEWEGRYFAQRVHGA